MGVHLLMNSLRHALNQRRKSTDRQVVNYEAAADANRAVQLLRHAGRVTPLMPTPEARRESKEDQEHAMHTCAAWPSGRPSAT